MSETTNNISESKLHQIRKLLALKDNATASMGEVENAAAMAQKLMDKYRLSLKDIPKEQRDELISEMTFSDKETGRLRTWKIRMISMIANLNGCVAIGHGRANMSLVGKEHDRQLVEYLSIYIIRQVQTLANQSWNERGGMSGMIYSTYTQHFGIGAVASIYHRMHDERERDRTNAEEITALVKVDAAAAQKWIDNKYVKLRTTKNKTKTSEATHAGYVAGASVDWHKGINAGQKQKMID